MTSRADQHDLDKLKRWRQNLEESSGDFPVCVVFLVSQADQKAHDTFRAYRNSFEARNAGFENLLIFGQHGISKAVHVLLAALGLSDDSLPAMVLLMSPQNPVQDTKAHSLTLPAGGTPLDESAGVSGPADQVLAWVEKLIDERQGEIQLEGIAELTELEPLGCDLVALVEGLIAKLS